MTLFIPSESDPEHEKLVDMAREATRNEIHQFFVSLDKDQLKTLRVLFAHALSQDPERIHAFVAHHDGMAAMLLRHKFNACPGCGIDHDKELHEYANTNQKEKEEDPEESSLTEYNVERFGQGEKVRCKGCGAESPNLNDRMFRSPGIEGCDGCQQKAKHG